MEESVKHGATTRKRIEYIAKKNNLDIDISDKNEASAMVELIELTS